MRRIGIFLRTAWNAFRNRYLSFGLRLILGATFIAAGAGKLPMRDDFVYVVIGYHVLPDAMAQSYAIALPWVEIVIGAFLILGLFSRIASGVGILTVLSFIIANTIVLSRGLNPSCDCLGWLASLQTRDALIIDFVLLIMAVQILLHKGDFLSLDSRFFRRKAPEPVSE